MKGKFSTHWFAKVLLVIIIAVFSVCIAITVRWLLAGLSDGFRGTVPAIVFLAFETGLFVVAYLRLRKASQRSKHHPRLVSDFLKETLS